MPQSKPSPDVARRAQVLELRKAGATWSEIGAALGFSKQRAHVIFQKALDELNTEPAADLRKLEAERLDKMQRSLWQQALQGNQGAVDRVLRIMERRAKMFGLDAPVRQSIEQVSEIRVEYSDRHPTASDAAADSDS